MQITGIVLAGGQSKRMGTDKALIELGGKTLLERAVWLCRQSCSSVLVSSNNPDHQVGPVVVPDEITDCGPMGGIYSCLKRSETDWNLVVSVDAAFVEPDFIKHLVGEIENCDAVVPISKKGKEPLIALYHKNCLPVMEKMLDEGDYKMHNLVNKVNSKWLESQSCIEKYPKLFLNLNRPGDFEAAGIG